MQPIFGGVTAFLLLSMAMAISSDTGIRPQPATETANKTIPVSTDHELARLAKRLKPGEWGELKCDGYNKAFLQDTRDGKKPVHQIFQYTNKISWHAADQSLYFMGAGHASRGKFIRYNAPTNTWERLPQPEKYKGMGRSGMSHTYESTSIDPENNWLVRQTHMDNILERYDLVKKIWIESWPSTSKGGHRSATEYFPPWKTWVRLETQSKPPLLRLDRKSMKWQPVENVDQTKIAHGNQPVIEFNPVCSTLLFGGGNNQKKLFLMDEKGAVKSIADPPMAYVNSTHINVVTVDPAGGEYLIYAGNGKAGPKKFYAYHVEKNTWRPLDNNVPFGGGKGTAVASPVADHGVVVFCSFEPCKVWLYKHKMN